MGAHTKLVGAKGKKKPKAKPKAKASKKKTPAKPKAVPADEPRAALGEQFEDAIQKQLDSTMELLDSIKETTAAGEASPALARETANLQRSLASLSAEYRQLEKHAKAEVENFSAEETHMLVGEYLRELDYDGRKYFRELLIELDGERSLLG